MVDGGFITLSLHHFITYFFRNKLTDITAIAENIPDNGGAKGSIFRCAQKIFAGSRAWKRSIFPAGTAGTIADRIETIKGRLVPILSMRF